MSGSFPDYPGWLLRLCATAGFVPRVLHEADTATSLFGLVSAGFGVAILPALHDPPSFEIEFRPLDPDVPEFEFFVAWQAEDRSRTLDNFIEVLRANVQSLSG